MRIVLAIDVLGGKCVRLTKGDYNTSIVYSQNPLEVAKEIESNGITYVHLVDLDGAKSKHVVNQKVLYEIATKTKLKIDFGGGVKTDEDIKIVFENGALQVTVGSIAIDNPQLLMGWLKMYGSQKIILGADCKNRKIATHGWLENTKTDIVEFIENYQKKGIEYVICTDVLKDGMMQGTSEKLYKEILTKIDIKLIASGGVTNINDLVKLKSIGCEGAIVGKAFYNGNIKLKDLKSIC
jgi:phosphoribosylformimino-5-aminoimidazole carboxamide ribotide isomerase